MYIEFKQIAYNYTLMQRNIDYIIIHDTGNFSVGADEEANYTYFNTGDRQSSADFFVGNKVLQVNDYTKGYSWAVGDGGAGNTITNVNSISIEMCVNVDGNYEKTKEYTIELVQYLMSTLNIPITNVKRHYDVSYKNCPQSMNNNGDWSAWYDFKVKVEGDVITALETQQKLNLLGYGLDADGIKGNGTRNAVKNFQRFFKLPETGIVDNDTKTQLLKVCDRKTKLFPPF
jgi:N-acetylmuramoyl-L-alanine amidase CwlA